MSPRTPRPARRHRRPVTAVATLAAAALAIPLLSACGAVNKAMDCADAATAIVNSVDKLQQAAENSLDDPQKAEQALDKIDQNLKKVRDSSSDPELAKSLDKMNAGIKNARKDIKSNNVPDLQPITDGAGDLTKTCTPG
ncbi:hypothetical protein [Streptomyces sp. NPDC053427]|uniref:hypothetical protein n=1 Tax=Streptomyces sp. NPDC053427 TaxID=3365701 RepID=UPI0037D69E09